MARKLFLCWTLFWVACGLLACERGEQPSWLVRSVDVLLSHRVPLRPVAVAAADTAMLRLDTRSWAEYAVSHLPGAIWVGYDRFDSSRVAGLSRQRPILVYCSVGVRSETIGTQLQALGFDAVYNLAGGLFEWHNQGYPLHRAGRLTDTLHGYDRHWGLWVQGGVVVYAPSPAGF